MRAAVEARDLFRVYAGEEGSAAALQGLTLEVQEGEIVVVFGPSGSGKTTFLRIVAGLETPSAGRIRVFGVDLRRLGGRRLDRHRARTIGYADQHYSRLLPPELTVREIIELPLALAGVGRAAQRARSAELLERAGLADRGGAHPRELSGGEQQRVALCAVVAPRPRLLLADEPTGELDDAGAGAIYRLIEEVVRAEDGTALIVSHDLGSTVIADRIIKLTDGRVSAETVRGEREAIVVGTSGWLRLPEELLARSGIGGRAHSDLAEDGVLLASAEETTTSGRKPGPARRMPQRHRGVAAQLDAVTKRFGDSAAATTAVDGLSASFAAGRITAVTGRSGSGKTTVLHLLAGLELPTGGEVRVLETPISRLDRAARAAFRRERIALVAQDPPLVPFLTVEENVGLAIELRSGAGHKLSQRAAHALSAVGMFELAHQRVGRLSMGERQRVAIARAAGTAPALLLADEPTARLDQANAAALGELFARLVDEFETTLIFSTHDQILLSIADDVLAL